jgi:hypothetical protein
MITEVQNALDSILGHVANLLRANGAGRLFELFVMTGMAENLSGRGYDVWLQRSDGSRMLPGDPTLEFIQRGGAPGGIAPAASGAGTRVASVSRGREALKRGRFGMVSSLRAEVAPLTSSMLRSYLNRLEVSFG